MSDLQLDLIRSQIRKNISIAEYTDLKMNLIYAFWIVAFIGLALFMINVDYILERI